MQYRDALGRNLFVWNGGSVTSENLGDDLDGVLLFIWHLAGENLPQDHAVGIQGALGGDLLSF